MKDRIEKIIIENMLAEPDSRAIWWKGEWWSRHRLLAMAERCGERLRSCGFDRGDRLAVLLPDSPMVHALSLAVWSLGGTIVPLNSRAGARVILPTLDLIDPFAVVMLEGKNPLADEVAKVMPVVSVAMDGDLPYFRGRRGEIGDPDLAVIFATSGTTGFPKAVPLTHANLLDNVSAVREVLDDLDESDVVLNVLPNFHSFGFTLSGILPLACGLSEVIVPSFMPPHETLEAIAQAGVTVLFVVPAMLSFLLSSIEHGYERPKGLKLIITGGDRLNVQLDRRVNDCLGVPVLEGYGLTECSPVVAVNPSYSRKKLGTIGPVMPSYEWQIRDRSGELLPSGREGVLWVRGGSVFGGYFRSPEITATRFDGDWFNTGDVVRADEEGYITVLDRVTDIIIVGGFNVYPQEVERILNAHPEVSQAAVVGMKCSVNGETPRAFVLRESGSTVSEKDIIAYCKRNLAHYKVPRKVEFVDSLPLSASGKILRRKLRDL